MEPKDQFTGGEDPIKLTESTSFQSGGEDVGDELGGGEAGGRGLLRDDARSGESGNGVHFDDMGPDALHPNHVDADDSAAVEEPVDAQGNRLHGVGPFGGDVGGRDLVGCAFVFGLKVEEGVEGDDFGDGEGGGWRAGGQGREEAHGEFAAGEQRFDEDGAGFCCEGGFDGGAQAIRGVHPVNADAGPGFVGFHEAGEAELLGEVGEQVVGQRFVREEFDGPGDGDAGVAQQGGGPSFVEGEGHAAGAACGAGNAKQLEVPLEFAVFPRAPMDHDEDAVEEEGAIRGGGGEVPAVDGEDGTIGPFCPPAAALDANEVGLVAAPVDVLHDGLSGTERDGGFAGVSASEDG